MPQPLLFVDRLRFAYKVDLNIHNVLVYTYFWRSFFVIPVQVWTEDAKERQKRTHIIYLYGYINTYVHLKFKNKNMEIISMWPSFYLSRSNTENIYFIFSKNKSYSVQIRFWRTVGISFTKIFLFLHHKLSEIGSR